MDEYEANVEKIGLMADELLALLPEEPSSELEVKVAEMLALVIAHLDMLEMDDSEDDGEEAAAEEVAAEEDAAAVTEEVA